MSEQTKYPQFRKYLHGRTFFKISSETEWEEIGIIGEKYILNEFKVAILPDRNFLHDITFDYEKNWVKITEQEYEEIKKHLAK